MYFVERISRNNGILTWSLLKANESVGEDVLAPSILYCNVMALK